MIAAAVHMASTLAIWSIAGIPLFRASRLAAFEGSGGLGILERLAESSGMIAVFSLVYLMVRRREVRRSVLAAAFLIWFLATVALSGSKGALLLMGQYVLSILFVYTGLRLRKDRFWGGRTGKLLIVVSIVFAIGVLVAQQEERDLSIAGVSLAFRLISYGDVYVFAYPGGTIEAITGDNPLVGMFGGFLSTFRLFPQQLVYPSIGIQFTNIAFPELDLAVGPNPQHPVFGYHYFGAFAFVFSFVLGVVTAGAQRMFLHRRHGTFFRRPGDRAVLFRDVQHRCRLRVHDVEARQRDHRSGGGVHPGPVAASSRAHRATGAPHPFTCRMRTTLEIRAVCVCYHLAPGDFAARLQSLAARANARLHGVIIGNHAGHPAGVRHGDMEVLRGTNAHLDFSGYFEGLEHLLSTHGSAADGNVLFVNDSLFTKHSAAAILPRVLKLDELLKQLEVPAIGGKLDPYRSICTRNPWSGQAGYVSSFCFLLNARAQPTLRRLIDDARADGVLSDAPVGDALWAASLDPLMREHIRAHLVYQGSPYLWPGANHSDSELVRKKARCVYFEHRLSGAIGLGGAVVPINAGPRSRAGLLLGETIARASRALRAAT
jgi:hypothetical protein